MLPQADQRAKEQATVPPPIDVRLAQEPTLSGSGSGPAPALVGAVGPYQGLRNIQGKLGPLFQSPLGEDRQPGPILQGKHRGKLVAEVRRRAGNRDRHPIAPAPAAIGGLQQSRLQSAG